MRRLLHQLARLHPAELRERAVRRLIAPDALRGREQRIAAIAVLVVAVVLVTVDDDFVADLPALHLRADRPDNAGGVRAGDMKRLLMNVERRDRLVQARPDAVVVDAGGHHEDQHVFFADRPGRHDFELHRLFRRPVPILPDHPRMHLLGDMTEGRDFAHAIEILQRSNTPHGGSSRHQQNSLRDKLKRPKDVTSAPFPKFVKHCSKL